MSQSIVLDELDEIPVCVGYKINGKATEEIPAHASGYDKIECVYRSLPGWKTATHAITHYDKLPQATRDYLAFVEKESGSRVGVVSNGPDRNQTIFVDEFAAALKSLTQRKGAKAH